MGYWAMGRVDRALGVAKMEPWAMVHVYNASQEGKKRNQPFKATQQLKLL